MKLTFILSLVLTTTGFAQNWNSLLLPANSPFSNDSYLKTRPGLTLYGWDNTRIDGVNDSYSQTTLGVKQVLERTFVSVDSQEKEIFEKIVEKAKAPLHRNYSNILGQSWGTAMSDKDKAAENAVILESRALVALITYVVEKNPQVFDADVRRRVRELYMPDGVTVLTSVYPAYRDSLLAGFRLLNGFTNPAGVTTRAPYFANHAVTEIFKDTRTLNSVVRAQDLYLALEKTNNNISVEAFT